MNPCSSPSAKPSFFLYPSAGPFPDANPNPNCNSFDAYNQFSAPPRPPRRQLPLPSDLRSALSTLKDLISLCESTNESISNLLGVTSSTIATSFSNRLCSCPFDSHHRMPPESLFLHTFQCPSSDAVVDLAFAESLHYPNTLQSLEDLIRQNRFLGTLRDSDSELCFSIDEYVDLSSNFFYLHCPGVVSSSDLENMQRTFMLPVILSAECSNFLGRVDCHSKAFSGDYIIPLPSESWLVRSEIEAWMDYPTGYSYRVLQTLLCLSAGAECDFLKWVILNSPRYGIVIDVPMRDHIVLLFRLCLKAIIREAVGFTDAPSSGEVKELNMTVMWFNCPILVEVLTWFSFQLSVLYGEVNGKFFSIDMLKQWLLCDSGSSLFAPKSSAFAGAFGGKLERPLELTIENERNSIGEETIYSGTIFISQVAAAVAALHERSLLEGKIKPCLNTHSLTNCHRIADHASLSRRADEERQKRSNYRTILEHDGLLGQRSCDQETRKVKTREELLAEERDYKRRRMSYRGKKLKRTTVQTIRDIIDDYMEEIKEAGGIGCLVNRTEGTGTSNANCSFDNFACDEQKKAVSNSDELSRGQSSGYGGQSLPQDNIRFSKFEDEFLEDHTRHRHDSHWHPKRLHSQKSFIRDRRDREHYSRLPDVWRITGHSDGYTDYGGLHDNMELPRNYLSRSPDRGSHSRSLKCPSHRGERNEDLEVKNRQRRKEHI